MKAKMLTITAAAVAPTSNVVANWGRTGATRPKPIAIRKAATSITLMSRGRPDRPGAGEGAWAAASSTGREVLLIVRSSLGRCGPAGGGSFKRGINPMKHNRNKCEMHHLRPGG